MGKIIIIHLVICLIVFSSQAFEPSRNVSIDVDKLKLGPINVYFVCPNVQTRNDVVSYYKIINGEKILLFNKIKGYGVVIKLTSPSDLGTYTCTVESENNPTRNAFMYVMDKNTMENPTRFVYDTNETIYVTPKEGSVDLNCGESSGKPVTWFRPPQYHIHSGEQYKIDNINSFDYGTYYCAIGSPNKLTLNVKKVILVMKIPDSKEKPINKEFGYIETLRSPFKTVRYRSHNLINRTDVAVWEQPPGTILLDHGRDIYFQSLEGNQSTFFYRITRNGDPTRNVVGKLLIYPKQKDNKPMEIDSRVTLGKEFKLKCINFLDNDNDVKVIWKKDDQIIHRGNTLTIPKFEKDSFGKYSCDVEKGAMSETVSLLSLLPTSQMKKEIEMSQDPGSYYLYHYGNKKELHCEIHHKNDTWKIDSANIIWTINDKTFNKDDPIYKNKISRLDTASVSILILNYLTLENQGTYKCFQGPVVLAAKLMMEQKSILLELGPSTQTADDNNNQAAELHCRIDTENINSSAIVWKFIPENSETEIDIPLEAKIENPIATSSTSFLTIDNVLKKHEGTYVCQVSQQKVFGKIVVRTKPVLSVTPKVITLRPGGTARFVCLLNVKDGKVTWRRKDGQRLRPNKENIMGGSVSSQIELKQAEKEDHATIYECVYNNLIEEVTVYVEEECPLHQRKCKNNTCINETKFCDGKNDCGDNSDEDRQKCNECNPNAIHCDFLKDANPTKRCIIKHWQCDGVDDCGNNFDELNCPLRNRDKCIGSHFQCDNDTLIPRSYWCDGEQDCKSGDDETDCSHPQVIEPTKIKQISVFSNSTLELVCQISGRPIPTISWRFNWGHLPEGLDYNVSTIVSNCSIITSTLTVNNINSEQSGIYSCEGISKRRVMAPDFSVTVSKGSVCKRPFYNNDAWYPDMCIRCYCSNVTDDCSSATGYTTSGDIVESGLKASDAAIVNHKTMEYYDPAKEIIFVNSEKQKYFINDTYYKKFVPNPDYYFGGAFNMAGSWITRYGYPLTYTVILSGDNIGPLYGPLVTIKGESKAIYHCRSTKRLPLFASKDKYENNIKINLWEQDSWYKDDSCSEIVTHGEFIDILKDVRMILFKVKYFLGQTDFEMSKISFKEAIETKDKYAWVAKLEKCNCPTGFSGLSCEIKSNP